MKNPIKAITISLLFLLTACARVEVIETGDIAQSKRPSTSSNEIFIVTSSSLPGQVLREIGIVRVTGMQNINEIYRAVRKEASAKGAQGVVGFDLDSEEITIASTSTSCMPNGGCTTSTTYTTNYQYTASGTLVYFVEEI